MMLGAVGLTAALLIGAAVTWCCHILATQFWPVLQARLKLGRKLPRGSMGWPYFGENLEYLSSWTLDLQNPDAWFDKRRRKYGDVFRTFLMGTQTVVMLGAAANQFVLSNENKLFENRWPRSLRELEGENAVSMVQGEVHARLRRALNGFLSPAALDSFLPTIQDAVLRCLSNQELTRHDVIHVDVFPVLRKLAFEINAQLFMGLSPGAAELERLHSQYEVFTLGLESQPLDLPWTHFGKAKRARGVLLAHIVTLIRRRREQLISDDHVIINNGRHGDMLDLMLMARDEESGELYSEQVIAENMLLLVHAGQDTTASALATTLLHLARCPDIAAQIRSECKRLASSRAGDNSSGHTVHVVSREELKSLELLRCALKEGLRLCPPVTGFFKRAKREIQFEEFTIPKGWTVHIVARHTHLNEEFFEDPKAFKPLRFSQRKHLWFSYVPFGQGARICPGMHLANITMELFLYHFFCTYENFELLHPNEQMVVRTFSPYPQYGQPMRLTPIKEI